MTYACVVFAHNMIDLLQRIQNKFLRMASGCLWYVRNVDINKTFEFCTHITKRYYEHADSNYNPFIVETCKCVRMSLSTPASNIPKIPSKTNSSPP